MPHADEVDGRAEVGRRRGAPEPPVCCGMLGSTQGGHPTMVDKYHDPLLTTVETARHLEIPPSTLHGWLSEEAAGAPLVHRVSPTKHGWPSIPFIAVVEAYVLRSLRDLGLTKRKIREAAAAVRREFGTPYGLATGRIATDGIDIFLHYTDHELVRASDGQ